MAVFGSTNPVFDMLKQDHAKVKQLFEEFDKAEDSRTKERIIRDTLLELEVHAKLEEMLIYPAIREQIDAEDVMDEALEEHHVAHTLINELKRRTGSTGRYEAKFKVLGESIKHHVKEEEGTMFPEAQKADIDWEALAQTAMERKAALQSKTTRGNGARGRRQPKPGRKTKPQRSRKGA
jgi:hemerythrin superfamily protein